MNNGNWGVRSRTVVSTIEKPNSNGCIRVAVIETKDDMKFVDIRNWYDKAGEEGYNNPGKGIWLPMDADVLGNVVIAVGTIVEENFTKA